MGDGRQRFSPAGTEVGGDDPAVLQQTGQGGQLPGRPAARTPPSSHRYPRGLRERRRTSLCRASTDIRALTMADPDSHADLTDWPDQPPGPGEVDITTFNLVRHHITRGREKTRLCDGRAAGGADISTSNLEAMRQARAEATLCPVCQQNSHIHDYSLRPDRYHDGKKDARPPLHRPGAVRLRRDTQLLPLPGKPGRPDLPGME